ncbi:M1 family metallopeptidase [Promicromonospora panici]|uniref:M1 family metallopeptidase n=1 Tax=Promicromonospora panici TaxID=2219658 RepID=UPI0013EE1C94|nr:M1 family metallopeptidase [Promicromonospora panici]
MVATVLAGVVAGTATAAGSADGKAAAGVAADASFDVLGYDVAIGYQPDTQTLEGDTTVSATATEALDSLTLQLSGPAVRSVAVDGEKAESFSRAGEQDLVIVPATPIGRGDRFRVRVTYDGTPGPGWLGTTSGGATTMIGSSSAWFPVHDDARDRASFSLAATVPDGWRAVSVGREGTMVRTAGASTFRWAERDVDPDHVAVTIDRLTTVRSALADGTPVVDAYAPGLRDATEPLAKRLPEVLGFLSGRFGPYPFDAAGNVFVHVNDDGPGIAPQTRTVYLGAGNEQYMTLRLVVHEQAHQWYGVSVTPHDPEDVCLSECFAEYATWLWDEERDGVDLDARYRDLVEANRGDDAFWGELYRPGATPQINLYSKGPVALHALRRQVGDEAFDRLLRAWPQEHRGEYATWPQLESFAEQVTGQDLTGFYRAWFRGAGVPSDEYLWPGELAP